MPNGVASTVTPLSETVVSCTRERTVDGKDKDNVDRLPSPSLLSRAVQNPFSKQNRFPAGKAGVEANNIRNGGCTAYKKPGH